VTVLLLYRPRLFAPWAFKYNEGLWSGLVYMGHYAGTLERGPADPDYGTNETGEDPDYPEP